MTAAGVVPRERRAARGRAGSRKSSGDVVIVCCTAVDGSAAPRHVGVEILLADQHAAAGVRQDLHQLALAQHRIARHDHRAALPGREHRDQHLRDVLQVHRDAIAGLDAAPLQRDGKRIGHRVELRRP